MTDLGARDVAATHATGPAGSTDRAAMSPEPSAPLRLIDTAGDVRVGIFDTPVDEVNYRDFRLRDPFGRPRGRLARHVGFKQFQFIGGVSEGLVFGCAIADMRYAGLAFAYCYEPATRRRAAVSFRRPLGLGLRFGLGPEEGTSAFASGRDRIAMHASRRPAERRLEVDLARGVRIDAVLDEAHPPAQPMRICTRAGAAGWAYARKTAAVPVTGTFVWEGRRFDLGALGVLGHHDWSAGYMRRETFWNWGCLAGTLADGRAVGLNASCGVNETSFTENCFWVDGRLHKLDSVHFAYDERDLTRPWRVTSFDGRLDLAFHPESSHRERTNAWLVASSFTQLVGRYRGRLDTPAGERILVDGLLGYAERHYAKW